MFSKQNAVKEQFSKSRYSRKFPTREKKQNKASDAEKLKGEALAKRWCTLQILFNLGIDNIRDNRSCRQAGKQKQTVGTQWRKQHWTLHQFYSRSQAEKGFMEKCKWFDGWLWGTLLSKVPWKEGYSLSTGIYPCHNHQPWDAQQHPASSSTNSPRQNQQMVFISTSWSNASEHFTERVLCSVSIICTVGGHEGCVRHFHQQNNTSCKYLPNGVMLLGWSNFHLEKQTACPT